MRFRCAACCGFHPYELRIDRRFRIFVGQCGLYRTGSLWAHSAFGPGCSPDIITMAKPLANGYPIGAVMMREEVAQAMSVGKPGNSLRKDPNSNATYTCHFRNSWDNVWGFPAGVCNWIPYLRTPFGRDIHQDFERQQWLFEGTLGTDDKVVPQYDPVGDSRPRAYSWDRIP